jgi:hypothetical protein
MGRYFASDDTNVDAGGEFTGPLVMTIKNSPSGQENALGGRFFGPFP